MSTVRSIYRNLLFLSSGEIISKILQFVLMVYAARILDQASFGKFSFALSLSFIAIITADLGINQLLIREIARDKGNAGKYFINAFVVKLVFALITWVFIIFLLNALNYPKDTRYIVYLIWIFTIISTFTDLFYSIFRAFERMFYDSLIKILRMSILASVGLYVLINGYGILAFSFVFIVVEILMVSLACIIAQKNFIKIRLDLSLRFMKNIVKTAFPLGMAFFFSSIYFYIDSIMLSKMKGDVEVAIYSVAYNLALAILFIPAVYTNAVYPVMSRYYKTSKENLIYLYKKSFKYLYIIGLPISAGLYVLAGRIIFFFYGEPYKSSVIALQIISWFLFIKFLNYLMAYALSSVDQQNSRMIGQGLTAAFNVVLNLILIPKMGYIGAAVSTFFTEIFLFILYYWYTSKSLHRFNFAPILIKPLIATGIMVTFIIYAKLRLFLIMPLAVLIYFAVILLLRTFEEEDYQIFRKIFIKADIKEISKTNSL
ncbi:MAG TPA: flippase [Candidatus Nanoarchaeia archaeon]|nr:flippase [Candidatus Nanoarchaeia archaeon]